ncbi:MAG: lasso peptide biosynthesis B2 protein [Rhodospirillaceae bacterium]
MSRLGPLAAIRKLLSLPRQEQLWTAEAWLRLAVWVIKIRLLPGARITRTFATGQQESPEHRTERLSPDQRIQVERLQRCISRASRYHLLGPNCMPQALTARAMLTGRGLPATLVLGVRKKPSEPTLAQDGELAAHAWVLSGELTVTGAEGSGRFQPLGVFPSAPG